MTGQTAAEQPQPPSETTAPPRGRGRPRGATPIPRLRAQRPVAQTPVSQGLQGLRPDQAADLANTLAPLIACHLAPVVRAAVSAGLSDHVAAAAQQTATQRRYLNASAGAVVYGLGADASEDELRQAAARWRSLRQANPWIDEVSEGAGKLRSWTHDALMQIVKRIGAPR